MRRHMVTYRTTTVNGKSRTEIPGRLPDDEYEAMSASLRGKREMHGRSNEWRNGDYSRFRDRREEYVKKESGRES